LVSYTKHFNHDIGHDSTNRIILLTAITRGAAMESEVHTSALIFKDRRRKDHRSFNDIEFFQDTGD
jgi:hypothetical protein